MEGLLDHTLTFREFYEAELARERFGDRNAGHDYTDYHKDRLSFLKALCNELKPDPASSVLDVGRTSLSYLLATYYSSVSTIGFPVDSDIDDINSGVLRSHYLYDLNAAGDGIDVEVDQRFDLITFAETIEHLHVAPELILYALSRLLTTDGFLVCQTPNAVALHRRLAIIRGKHPYERLRLDKFNPGHVREYTRDELIEIGRKIGLKTVRHYYKEYFGYQGSTARRAAIAGLKAISTIVPSFSRGQTIVYAKDR
jgi:2-polyprenyl-3-methyl-5-hydroxy-6-metoxy-1,4-benzoquinol methylase